MYKAMFEDFVRNEMTGVEKMWIANRVFFSVGYYIGSAFLSCTHKMRLSVCVIEYRDGLSVTISIDFFLMNLS